MKPFLKWAGGKGQLLPYIAQYYPFDDEDFKKYAEPFIGGGAVLFDVLEKYKNLEQAYISDINPYLINTYICVKVAVEDLIEQLLIYQDDFMLKEQELRREYFYKNRSRFNELVLKKIRVVKSKKSLKKDHIEMAALLIFLNRTCYNGLYRVNRNGLFNVPIGNYKNPLICDTDNLKVVSKALKKVKIEHAEYQQVEKFVDNNTFVYIDPPYRPISQTGNFTSYTPHIFDDESQEALCEVVRSLSDKGARILLSNSDPRSVDPNDYYFDKLYDSFYIKRIDALRLISRVNRDSVKELLISNIKL